MSDYSVEDYLKCYEELSKPQLSKKANNKLLEIEDSFAAWEIAFHLISDHLNLANVMHGTQLLSKKLNTPPPIQINLEIYLNLLYNVFLKTSLCWLCIAKIAVHLINEQPIIPSNYTNYQQLCYLKEIPAALSHVRTKKSLDDLNLRERYMELAIPIIFAEFHAQTRLIIETLDSFLSYGTKIRNAQMVRALLTLPFQTGEHVLEEILSRETYPELQNEILAYLEKQQDQSQVFEIYMAFFKTINYSQLSFDQLVSGLKRILNCLINEKEQPKSKLSESYQLWQVMAKQYKEKELNAQLKQAIRDALLTVWRITCKQAILNHLPQKAQTIDPLDLGGGDDEDEQTDVYYQANQDIEDYR